MLKVIDRAGLEEFCQTLRLQNSLVDSKISDPTLDDMLVLAEHPPVYTVGRTVPFQKLSTPYAEVPWYEISRGGQATFHGPGQLVAYPILDLKRHGKDVHVYLRKLEQAVIQCLKKFAIEGITREGLTGVWVKGADGQPKKIASIGVGVRKWISFHGVGINLTTDLDYFRAISACGQNGEVMTSIWEVLRESIASENRVEKVMPSLDQLKQALVESMQEVFGFVKTGLEHKKKPAWLKVRAPGSAEYLETRKIVKSLRLNTVCEEAKCPNIGECWSHHTATFMIMGDLCTRRCGFCSVKDGLINNLQPLDMLEPLRVGKAIAELGLRHVVITSVNRDDLDDMGADHFNATVKAIAHQSPQCKIELLIPDMRGEQELVRRILQNGVVDVLNHNIETVPRLYKRVRPGAIFKRSLNILAWAKEFWPKLQTKSGLMVGLGEKREEVLAVMDSLREINCNILTIGQYLQPTPKQLPVERFVTPEEFEDYRIEGLKRGFNFVESGPLVRSSYHAWKHTVDSPTLSIS